MGAATWIEAAAQSRPCLVGAGFALCVVLIWVHKAFERWLFGHGVLEGQRRSPPLGQFVNTARGRVHYLFLDKHGDCRNDLARTGPIAAAETSRTPTPAPNAAGTTYGAFDAPLLDAEAATTPMQQARHGERLEYGGVHGELVVILHGFAGSSDPFINDERSGYASFLNANGYAVLAPDLYGHGHSDGPDTTYSSELFAEQLAELCLVFGISKPFDLFGFSMGGSVALIFAHRYPHLVRRLVLQAPHIVESPLRPSLQVALRIPFFRELVAYVIISFIGENRGNPAAVRASYRLLLTNLHGGGRWTSPGRGGSTKEMLRAVEKEDRIQVFMLWGEKDSTVGITQSRKALRLAPRSQLVTHRHADHMTFADGDPEVRAFFRTQLLSFLRAPDRT
ncbi:Monoacylglycerol lipase ABHD6 [Hondaea fermentalgiana]|uniref:Monoacylglycerol lipase ABHD6 n=1 Tax=Hondaea fermentalgiana TaxID=2315210 RepID=A0A2R5GSL6_9STRA|nr:Monoacylglycerol lipase ABHD6 [Hondaea fermentalgiana]|eukprot:GBG30874.1 Monoacylglycerol lipase ABHD6 [Hondaea fermentalgiana]